MHVSKGLVLSCYGWYLQFRGGVLVESEMLQVLPQSYFSFYIATVCLQACSTNAVFAFYLPRKIRLGSLLLPWEFLLFQSLKWQDALPAGYDSLQLDELKASESVKWSVDSLQWLTICNFTITLSVGLTVKWFSSLFIKCLIVFPLTDYLGWFQTLKHNQFWSLS